MAQAGKHLYLVANWKSNKTWEEAHEYVEALKLPTSKDVSVVICPPMPYVMPVAGMIQEKNMAAAVGVQDISPFPFGTYTGAVTGDMLSGIATYAIIGHSERRRYFHETNQEVENKVRTAIDSGITSIVCVDEPYITSQLAFFTNDEFKQMIVAYEPLSAIGSGTPDTPEHAEAMAVKIQQLSGRDLPVLYGGSVKAETVKAFTSMKHIAGVLVGGASLDPVEWNKLVRAVV